MIYLGPMCEEQVGTTSHVLMCRSEVSSASLQKEGGYCCERDKNGSKEE